MPQLLFPFAHTPGFSGSDFIVSECNAHAHALVTGWPDAWQAHALALTGPRGAGKTHLATIWAQEANAALLQGEQVKADFDPSTLPACVAVEEAERAGERPLLHLLNAVRERQGYALLTSVLPRRSWPFALPDLRSRTQALPLAELSPPDDALLEALAAKLFADRQLTAPPGVISFLLSRSERSFEALRAHVEALDAAGLREGRKITLALARKALGHL